MFWKKSSCRGKQRRSSCLLYCFRTDHSFTAHDSEPPLPAGYGGGGGMKGSATCFSWAWFRRKKGLPKPQVNAPKSAPSFQARIVNEEKTKVKRCRSPPANRPESSSGGGKLKPSNEFQHPLQPHLTPHIQTEMPGSSPETAPTRRQHRQFKHGGAAPSPPPPVSNPVRAKRGNKLGPSAGLTAIGVTLVAMVFYGRAAAVVSLCACLYLAAFLRQPAPSEEAEEKTAVAAGDVDVTSKEYKKKVVMEGFLDRSRIKPAGIVVSSFKIE